MQNFEELKEKTFSLIKEQIHKVINGEIEEIKFLFMFPEETIEWLENELKFEVIDGTFDINGWDWDWWQPMSKDDVKYTLSGWGWKGTMTFRKDQ